MTAPSGAVASTLARLRNVADAGGISFNDPAHQSQWRAFCRRIERPELSESLPQIAREIAAFLMPVVLADPTQAPGASWSSGSNWRAATS